MEESNTKGFPFLENSLSMKRTRESEQTKAKEDSNVDGLIKMTQTLKLGRSKKIPSDLCDLGAKNDVKKIGRKPISRSVNSVPANLNNQATNEFSRSGTATAKDTKPNSKRFKL